MRPGLNNLTQCAATHHSACAGTTSFCARSGKFWIAGEGGAISDAINIGASLMRRRYLSYVFARNVEPVRGGSVNRRGACWPSALFGEARRGGRLLAGFVFDVENVAGKVL